MAKVRRKKPGTAAIKASQRSSVPIMPKGYTIDRTTNGVPVGDQAGGYASADVEHGIIHSPGKLDKRELAHEIAHVFDYQVLSDKDRAKLTKVLRAPMDRKWYDRYGPAEYFADYYAAAAMGDRPGHVRKVKGGGLVGGQGAVNYTPIGRKRLRRFKRVMGRIGERENLGSGPLYGARPGQPMTGSNPIEQD